MIGLLTGKIVHIFEEALIINVREVGYQVTVSNTEDYSVNDSLSFWIYTHVREDNLQLFGFLTLKDKAFFLALIKISGIGPKMAMQILSGTSINKLIIYIESEDIKSLTSLPKIGKKKAEQMILSLKGKWSAPKAQKIDQSFEQLRKEVLSALLNLGFKKPSIEKSFEQLEEWTDFQSVVKICLNYLTNA
ncbi:MAG: Holliday junction branch migration protein RuvA [Bdellovibrionaceae bacterium]|nr:Holliday junction branch migration protein RuvA [Pseudobdellovibrionaceae bacterium]